MTRSFPKDTDDFAVILPYKSPVVNGFMKKTFSCMESAGVL